MVENICYDFKYIFSKEEKNMFKVNWSSYQLPCPIVFVSTAYEGKRDIMTATAFVISENEPLLAVSLAKGHLTSRLIEGSGRFTLILASETQKELALKIGSLSGEEKFREISFDTLTGESGKSLVPEGSSAWFECQVVTRYDVSDYHLFIGKVISQKNMNNPPLLWSKDGGFSTLKSL